MMRLPCSIRRKPAIAYSTRNELTLEPSSVLGLIAVEPDGHEGGQPVPAGQYTWEEIGVDG